WAGPLSAVGDGPQPVPQQHSIDATPDGAPAAKIAPSTASEKVLPPDSSLNYGPNCQPLAEALKLDSKLGAGRLDADAQFAGLRDARQTVVRVIQQANSAR